MLEQNALTTCGAFAATQRLHLRLSGGDIMSSINPPFRNLSLNPADMIGVNQAYDRACQTLQNIGQLEVDREIIAGGILQAAKAGGRDAQ
jgi:hypothetical protein